MQADGVIEKYAIGGAVGATFYLEPAATVDLDIFVDLPTAPGTSLVTLGGIYEYLTARGCTAEGEYIVIGDWPVQFLQVTDDLVRAARDRRCGRRFNPRHARRIPGRDCCANRPREGPRAYPAVHRAESSANYGSRRVALQARLDCKMASDQEEISMSDQSRKRLAGLPFAEKLRILDKLRERSVAIAAARKKPRDSQKIKKQA